jgi:hypothetical protein
MSSLKDSGFPEYIADNDLNVARSLGRTLRTVDNFAEGVNRVAASDFDMEANTENSQSLSESTSSPGAHRDIAAEDLSNINEHDHDLCDVEAPNLARNESSESDGPSRSRPGAYRVAGIDAPLDLNDDDHDDFISYNNSSSMEDTGAPLSSVPSITTATLVEPDNDRLVLLDEIRQLRAERENVARAEAIVVPIEALVDNQDGGDEEENPVAQHRCFPTRRRTLLCLLLIVCIAGLVFGIIIGIISLSVMR